VIAAKPRHAWLLLLALPPLSLALQAWHAARVATPEDLACAARVIREGFAEGDVVRFEPTWAYEAWPLLQELPIDRSPRLEARPLQSRRRLWVLATLGHDDPGPWPEGFDLAQTHVCGRATVLLVRLPYRGEPLYDFLARLEDARVERVYDGPGAVPRRPPDTTRGPDGVARQRCGRWKKGRWTCRSGRSWEWVGPVTKDVDDGPRRGLWAHPLDGGHALEITYPEVPLGAELEVEGGLTLHAIHAAKGAPVHFEVTIGGERVLHEEIGVTDKGWFPWTVGTSRWAGQRLPVRFTVRTADYQVRQWVFTGRTWRE